MELLVTKAARQAKLLGVANNLVAIAAVIVYLSILGSDLKAGEWMAFVPLTSVLLGVTLIHLFVRAALTHFAIIRESATVKSLGE
jgi:hypothetical protein